VSAALAPVQGYGHAYRHVVCYYFSIWAYADVDDLELPGAERIGYPKPAFRDSTVRQGDVHDPLPKHF